MFTSMDEFLCTRKPVEELVNGGEWTPCFRLPTFDVVHDMFNEPAIDMSKPTLPQRYNWKYAPGSTHPAIFHSGLAPALGWHSLAGIEPRDIPFAYGAVLAHFKREDYGNLVKRTTDRWTNWEWGVAKEMKGLSEHNKLMGDDLANWYFHDFHEGMEPIPLDFIEVP